VKNALAYFESSLLMVVKSFITLAATGDKKDGLTNIETFQNFSTDQPDISVFDAYKSNSMNCHDWPGSLISDSFLA
jgi:hypothetical protein